MITLRHRSLKPRKMQLKVEAVESPECVAKPSNDPGGDEDNIQPSLHSDSMLQLKVE